MNELIECQGDDRLALRGSDYIIKNDDDNADIPFTNNNILTKFMRDWGMGAPGVSIRWWNGFLKEGKYLAKVGQTILKRFLSGKV